MQVAGAVATVTLLATAVSAAGLPGSGEAAAARPVVGAIAPARAPAGGETAAAMWAFAGHHIICEIAFQRLTDEARDMVFAVRAADPKPSPTFYESCVWPDISRREDHRATYEYHFMNLAEPGADQIIMERDCANYDCVQLAVVRYANYLATDPGDSTSMKIRRANALKFVGHFVGDLHQPLHTGFAYDRGGNDTVARFYDESPSNLHGIWDYAIPERMGYYDDPAATARRLNAEITAAQAAAWENFDVVGWSRESYEVVKTLVYDVPPDGKLGDDYYERAAPIVERRMQQAGVRLAFLLNNAAAGRLDFPPMFPGA